MAEKSKHTFLSKERKNNRENNHLSPKQQERKKKVLTKGSPSMTQTISDAIVLKDEDIFMLSERDGSVPSKSGHGLGIFYHDCRFLNSYGMKIGGKKLHSLVSTSEKGYTAIFELTNPDLHMKNGTKIKKDSLGIKLMRTIDSANLTIHDLITLHHFGTNEIDFPFTFSFQAEFEDIFSVRGMLNKRPGKLRRPLWSKGMLRFIYDGSDDLHRFLSIRISPAPDSTKETKANCGIHLKPGESRKILVSIFLGENKRAKKAPQEKDTLPDFQRILKSLKNSSDHWLANGATVKTDNTLLNNVIERSLRDLRVLRSSLSGNEFFAAGIPWFATLFGRDSIIAALQTLAYIPKIAEQTLRLLAKYQGKKIDLWRDEQPGKILHELRVGELARLDEIPYHPYFGSVDATPLFLILIGRHAFWSGSLSLFHELKEPIDRAFEWISKYGSIEKEGYVEYSSPSNNGLINQGWKDSGNAIVNSDGSLARPPIALVEVQAYVYLAKVYIADLYARDGNLKRADELRKQAKNLRAHFNRDFWLEKKGTYAMALQKNNEPVDVISSNPGHALWAGIADSDKARQTAERLMSHDIFNGWGVRTLSDQERRFNPIGYHLGTVWPHDNSIIAAGFRRYGFDQEALQVFQGIFDAATNFEHYRLPEVFAGFRRSEYGVPVHYPVACHPQAWAAGSIPYLIQILLGLVPNAFEKKLTIIRPTLPKDVRSMEIQGLRIGKSIVDLRFEQKKRKVLVKTLKLQGDLQIVTERRIPRRENCDDFRF